MIQQQIHRKDKTFVKNLKLKYVSRLEVGQLVKYWFPLSFIFAPSWQSVPPKINERVERDFSNIFAFKLSNPFRNLFIGPKSESCLALSVSPSLSPCSFWDLIDVTLACEDSRNPSLSYQLLSVLTAIFIQPRSDHTLHMSLTHSLTHKLVEDWMSWPK